jgi:hypothetical protein
LSGGIILGQSQGALSAVPEPGTALLLAMGLVARSPGITAGSAEIWLGRDADQSPAAG